MSDRPTSAALHARASALVPGGVHSNTRYEAPHPTFYARGEGAYLWDVDGARYLDFTMGNGSILLGHSNPAVDDAVVRAVRAGLTTGVETAAAVEVVEALAGIIPHFGKVRLANTGTEALMHALAVARQATGRTRVAKAEGAYHGWSDALWVSTWPSESARGPAEAPHAPPSSGGLSPDAASTLVLPFNDLDGTERLLRDHSAELAAVVLEPVLIDIGFVPATPEYLEGVRRLTDELGIVLVFDELLTGFRVAPGGVRDTYGVVPDLTCYGKAIANGYPLAAVEGRTDLMALTDPTGPGPVGWVGTYNGHGVAVAAAA
ncbi:MAG TPA: aminotransferase class III-fold pyridoxal phosphate-dependent enzyme, partial [Streptosporangiales bacterium]